MQVDNRTFKHECQEGKELFVWLLDQSQEDLLELLAVCTAASINPVSAGRILYRKRLQRSCPL
ncbi:hypothetical protein SAMN05216404_12310 [Nitrosospira multiformis]|uniref:Uncharacterized protein n=1 Tax=Nitrosospira multiformis TaxID=1231 RepID=A0A1H8PUB2_9PROT|nr:hypothetical protein [Nitrosospira multiformis]SEO45351.1 hypothetical protein SAMN05216404_12310 [Nitrosospira multiformis]